MQQFVERLEISADCSDRSRAIKDQALAAGFDKVGIVRANVLRTELAHLKKWLDLGYDGQMKWMTRDPDLRGDPLKFFP